MIMAFCLLLAEINIFRLQVVWKNLSMYTVENIWEVFGYKYLSCVPGVDGKIHPEGVVQHRR